MAHWVCYLLKSERNSRQLSNRDSHTNTEKSQPKFYYFWLFFQGFVFMQQHKKKNDKAKTLEDLRLFSSRIFLSILEKKDNLAKLLYFGFPLKNIRLRTIFSFWCRLLKRHKRLAFLKSRFLTGIWIHVSKTKFWSRRTNFLVRIIQKNFDLLSL